MREKYKVQALYSGRDFLIDLEREERNKALVGSFLGHIGAALDAGIIALINNNISNETLKIIGIALFGIRGVKNLFGGVACSGIALGHAVNIQRNKVKASIK